MTPDHRPKLRCQGRPLSLGAPTRQSRPRQLHAFAHRPLGRIMRCHINPFLELLRRAIVRVADPGLRRWRRGRDGLSPGLNSRYAKFAQKNSSRPEDCSNRQAHPGTASRPRRGGSRTHPWAFRWGSAPRRWYSARALLSGAVSRRLATSGTTDGLARSRPLTN